MKIILASQSPRRKQLLSWIEDSFEVIPANINEEAFIPLARTPEELVVKLATVKAKQVVNGLGSDNPGIVTKDAIIVAADTIVVLDQGGTWEVIGKPKDFTQAEVTLRKLRGTTHTVYTGLCVLNSQTKQIATDFERTIVTFGKFSDEVMDEFIATGKPMDAAGAYMIQDVEKPFGISFQGSYTNIIGLPIKKTVGLLQTLSVPVKPDWQEKVKFETGYED